MSTPPLVFVDSMWRVSCPLVWRELDGEWLVYAVGNNGTHLLDPISAEVLRRLDAGGSLSHGELVACLTDLAEPDAVDGIPAVVDQVTRQLMLGGLILQEPG